MRKKIDPKKFGFHASTKIEQEEGNLFTLVLDRKSRIVMKDGEKILEKALKIRGLIPDAKVVVSTTAPVCSKTRQFLSANGITVLTS